MRSVLPWSWSSYESYETCPFKHYHVKIAKTYVEPEGLPLIWGNEVHKAIELYLKESTPVPDTMTRFIPLVDRIANAPGETYVELELACRIDLSPCGFWDDDAYVRGKGDIVKVNGTKALNGDWKTGKWKAGSLQLDLAAIMTFALFPSVEYVSTLFVYFQQPLNPVSKKFHRTQIPMMLAQFEAGVKNMLYSEQTNVWPKKPSGLCKKHCPVTECEYHGKGNPRGFYCSR